MSLDRPYCAAPRFLLPHNSLASSYSRCMLNARLPLAASSLVVLRFYSISPSPASSPACEPGRRTFCAPVAAAMAEQAHQAPQHVVVCGAGVIGACTAYFLARRGVQVTVVEKSSVACAASGKAGGFLALDWCDSTPLGKLARASFSLHQQLAEELGGDEEYGYRSLDTLSLNVEERPASSSKRSGLGLGRSVPAWVDGPVSRVSVIGSKESTAQVHPQLFTRKVLNAAVEMFGARLVTGEVQEIRLDQDAARVTGVVVDGEVVAADCAVIAMGPWSAKIELVSRLTTISGLKAHSIVLFPKEPEAITAHALFLGYRTKEGRALEPEIYPRSTGEVYVCGMSEGVPVPDDPEQIVPRRESIKMLERVAATVCSKLATAEVKAEQACFLPCSEDGLPLIGKIPDVQGAFVGTGHSCWGILNAPATGASLAELIAEGTPKTADLRPFDPARFARSSRRKTLAF